MKEALYNTAWRLGVRSRNVAKHAGILGAAEPVLLKLAPFLIPPPSQDVEITLPWDMTMIVPAGFPSARSYAAGVYEPNVTAVMQHMLEEGMTVVDLGANIGYYTLLASRRVGASGRVYAFEPDHKSHEYLLKNISANHCLNVVALHQAVSDSAGFAEFIPDPQGAEGHLSGTEEAGHSPSITVQTVSLDDFFACKGWPSIDLVKMDIEGGEMAALRGMRKLSHRNATIRVLMEFDLGNLHRVGGTVEDLASNLRELGFRNGHIIEQGLKPFSLTDAFPNSRAVYNLMFSK